MGRRRRRQPAVRVPVIPNQVQAPLWAALRTRAQPATVVDLHLTTRAHPSAIRTRLRLWQRSGLIYVVRSNPLTYSLTNEARRLPAPPVRARSGVLTPRRSTQTERLWRAMRVLKTFDVPQLLAPATATPRAAATLVSALFKAGYLTRIVDGGSSRRLWSRYKLVRNSGPLPPTVTFDPNDRARRFVIDGNTGERFERVAPAKKRVNHVR